MNRIPMTVDGAQRLREELDRLKNVERRTIIKAIATAREHGDLKENAEYHAAKEQQGFNEGRIKELESKLSHAQVIDVTKMNNKGRVIFGSTAHLIQLESNEEFIFKIVGEDESDLKFNKISVTSPMARALVGKEAGDEVEVQTPSGLIYYEISKVEYI